MPKLIDLTGNKYGRLTVIGRDTEKSKKRVFWLCKCDCGTYTSARSDALGKDVNSCGCLKKEQDKENLGRFTTGESHSRLANIWYHMKSRCTDQKADNYRHYGGRGITYHNEWDDFLVFKEWANANGYHEGMTLDRIEVDKHYTPKNCRWIPFSKQANNKRGTLWVTHNDEKKSLMEVYREIKPTISYQTVRTRYHKGIRDIDTLFSDKRKQ